jgi:putative ATPase
MKSLFDVADEQNRTAFQPLAERMRPRTLSDLLGQAHILAPGKPFRRLLESGKCPSLLLWGPPGCGKTTLARILSTTVNADFVQLSAVTSGVRDLKEVFEAARIRRGHHGRSTLLFVDEIHRFNKAQQDALLPHVEAGNVIFIGATTENPSFEVVSALLSRCQILTLQPLTVENIAGILRHALEKDPALMREPRPFVAEAALDNISLLAAGDARIALNVLETCFEVARQENALQPELSVEIVNEAFQTKGLRYDKGGEEHYNQISALHKSLRGSDPDASLYWLYRMIEAGEDCRFILRRMIRFASEDIGMAEPFALTLSMSAAQAFEYLGPPEGHLALAHLAVYLAAAPKSNAVYLAEKRAKAEVHSGREPGVPLHLRNAPTNLMKQLDYSSGYQYPHDFPGGFVAVNYFPAEVQNVHYYEPKPIGKEKAVQERLHQLWPNRYAAPGRPPRGAA